MLERFVAKFPVTASVPNAGGTAEIPSNVARILAEHGGDTHAGGFYRFHTPASSVEGNDVCAKLIKGFAGRFHCFAFDWMGRELAVDIRGGAEDGNVIAVDFGGGEYLKTDCPLSEWHDAVAGPEDPLAYPFYKEWRGANPGAKDLAYDQVIGYKVPLFLGGEDVVDNLEISDRSVYSELCTQLAHGARQLPEGATINSISISGN